jgi:CDP-diacylglycerol---glycerol-3-phosphate 3-phosphatidyltransferase
MDRETKRRLKHEHRLKARETKRRHREEKRLRKRQRPRSALLQEFWNLPNMLTLGRIAIIPLFVWFTADGDPMYSTLAASLFTLAAVTDIIDGYLARKLNIVTVTGKFLDPLADKLIVGAALVMLVHLGRVPAWLTIVLISREFIVTGLRQIAASEGMIIAAGQEGKWKTSLQLVGIVSLCIHYVHPMWFWGRWIDVNFNVVGLTLLYISAAFSVWSAAVYFRAFLAMLTHKQEAPGV